LRHAAQLFDTTPQQPRTTPLSPPRPADPRTSNLGLEIDSAYDKDTNRKHGLPRARYPFRSCHRADDKVWTGRLYTDSLARSNPQMLRLLRSRIKQEETALLTRSRCSNPTSTSQHHTRPTDGAVQQLSSSCSAYAYSSLKDGTSVRFSSSMHIPSKLSAGKRGATHLRKKTPH
jgi:hypothetical protein